MLFEGVVFFDEMALLELALVGSLFGSVLLRVEASHEVTTEDKVL